MTSPGCRARNCPRNLPCSGYRESQREDSEQPVHGRLTRERENDSEWQCDHILLEVLRCCHLFGSFVCMIGSWRTTCGYCIQVPVVPGQAGGGSFQKEKNYIAQKEFAYRMCARRPTSAMPKSFLCCERAFCRSMVVMFCALKWSVLMSWCLLRGQVMWWSRHLMRCNGLCCVMSRDAMRCHGDELYYSSTTLYYKVLLQYYSVLLQYYPVLQSTTQELLCTTPVLPCTTKYYSSTNLYYKVLLQYYSVVQSTTPILLCTTK